MTRTVGEDGIERGRESGEGARPLVYVYPTLRAGGNRVRRNGVQLSYF